MKTFPIASVRYCETRSRFFGPRECRLATVPPIGRSSWPHSVNARTVSDQRVSSIEINQSLGPKTRLQLLPIQNRNPNKKPTESAASKKEEKLKKCRTPEPRGARKKRIARRAFSLLSLGSRLPLSSFGAIIRKHLLFAREFDQSVIAGTSIKMEERSRK